MQDSFNEAAKFPLREKSIVFAGDLEAVTRRQASAIARQLGAKVTSEISPTTDFVVAGKDQARLQQAADQNIKVVSETDFFAMVKEQRRNQKELNGPK